MYNIVRSRFTDYCEGPEKSVCLLMEICGIGDDIHALPAVYQMLKDGYDVTIYGREFHREIWESLMPYGKLTFVKATREELGLYFVPLNRKKYGRILSLNFWGGWMVDAEGRASKDQFDQFAELIECNLPESFSWIDVLKPEWREAEPYVLFSSESAEPWRSLPNVQAYAMYEKLMREFGNVIWLSNEAHRLKTVCQSFGELSALVYNASRVVSVENGISNLAGAYNRPLTVLCGVTEPTHILGQYARYIEGFKYSVVYGEQPNNGICKMPCYRNPANGMIEVRSKNRRVKKCCGKYDKPYCMKNIDMNKVLLTVKE